MAAVGSERLFAVPRRKENVLVTLTEGPALPHPARATRELRAAMSWPLCSRSRHAQWGVPHNTAERLVGPRAWPDSIPVGASWPCGKEKEILPQHQQPAWLCDFESSCCPWQVTLFPWTPPLPNGGRRGTREKQEGDILVQSGQEPTCLERWMDLLKNCHERLGIRRFNFLVFFSSKKKKCCCNL